MNTSSPGSTSSTSGTNLSRIVEDEIELSLAELCRACEADHAVILELVSYGVLEPVGPEPASWRFAGASLRRSRVALRLIRHLDVNVAGAAVAVDLIEQIGDLQRALARRR